MLIHALWQYLPFLLVLLALIKPAGIYMQRAMEGQPPLLGRPGRWLERRLYRLAAVDPGEEMDWKRYAIHLLLFQLIGALFLYFLQRWQAWLPFNPQAFGAVGPDTAFNTTVSFVSNTSWQGYAGETTLSHLSQMMGINVQSFLSAASGIAVMMALVRGLTRQSGKTLGNVWVDLTRATLYILLPLSFALAMIFVQQGMPQTLSAGINAHTLDTTHYSVPLLDKAGNPVKDAHGQPQMQQLSSKQQFLALGPVASQEPIKIMSGDGGGFFNANSAHPYENPTPLSNFLEMLTLLILPAGLCYTFGRMVGDTRQGWTIVAAMSLMMTLGVAVCMNQEQMGNPLLPAHMVDQAFGPHQTGGNMEGKEVRFGAAGSGLFAAVTTSSGDGAVNAMHDSFMPIGGMVPMVLMQTGEVVFGGPGAGIYSIVIHAILVVFIVGLMIGRAPEYLGKKIEAFETKMMAIVLLLVPILILVQSAISVSTAAGLAGLGNPGAHGLSEVLYAYTSGANNNGSGFGGLSANTPFYNIMLAIAMWFGRYGVIVPVLALAGSLAGKPRRAPGAGTLPSHGPMFVLLLIATIVLVTALTYLPALALGPIAEHMTLVVR
ncbi:potassium-transporting ATPase subunit KdpA [Chromobacterium sp. IIBBL 290-4]|uniref:potassium-transporting ATPase subunit KdpA n=1 Tax=Chromobacterium sp. IIBBL 290-4 TaxID=2953890 RepID=UPI0020B8CB46|nr:potassium-transporting ATPase subunit KdpA [Chromobacterium sp. IIBBL 290-4]UTH75470.1 potassium-transporting ATPase subunit KdpA [Chromobacterium sp. IIBBL 290-4]